MGLMIGLELGSLLFIFVEEVSFHFKTQFLNRQDFVSDAYDLAIVETQETASSPEKVPK